MVDRTCTGVYVPPHTTAAATRPPPPARCHHQRPLSCRTCSTATHTHDHSHDYDATPPAPLAHPPTTRPPTHPPPPPAPLTPPTQISIAGLGMRVGRWVDGCVVVGWYEVETDGRERARACLRARVYVCRKPGGKARRACVQVCGSMQRCALACTCAQVRFCASVSILVSPYIEFPRWPAPTVEMRALPSSRSRRETSITTAHAIWQQDHRARRRR